MTRDDIISIAREAGMTLRGHYDESGSTPQELERFAALLEAKVRANVRKECAAICRKEAAETTRERRRRKVRLCISY